jgi:hypothetical protein
MNQNTEAVRLAKARLQCDDNDWEAIPADRRERLIQYYADELAMAEQTMALAGKLVTA